MTITWYGEGSFKIQTGETSLLTDPFDPITGLTPPRFKPQIILKTLNAIADLSAKDAKNRDGLSINGAGEYNLRGINILGIPLTEESTGKFLKTIYILEAEDIRLCLLGHLSEAPETATLQKIGEIDILFIPAGGKPFLDQKSSFKLVKQIEPKIVIPSFFKLPGLKRPAADVQTFLDEVNHKKIDSQEKLSIKSKELRESKSMQIAVLKI
ncbi:MBL fold metallo-hydrolase [Candidatus Wolfebacteria bacterium]|nr:MBL fold metallo-hydrolase [Candidatus Wolfebacteria bacterium]